MRILFQGDSITDAGSYRKEYPEITGYCKLVAEILGTEHQYFNRGVSGNRSCDVLARYEDDIKAIAPDVMTLMIGINDVWRRFDACIYESAEEYGKNVREILTRLKKDYPGVKIILIEPYLVPHAQKNYFRPVLAEFIQEIRAIAVELADGFVPTDGILAKANMKIPAQLLSADGVHPAEAGQQVIAEAVAAEIKAVCNL